MPTTKEFTIRLEDRPGTLGKLCQALAEQSVNILAFHSCPIEKGKSAVRLVLDMPFSSKAREIHDHIVSSGKADYWIGVARSLVERKGPYQSGKPYARDVPALKDKLKAELSGAVNDANDNHWEEIAHWLVYEARSN